MVAPTLLNPLKLRPLGRIAPFELLSGPQGLLYRLTFSAKKTAIITVLAQYIRGTAIIAQYLGSSSSLQTTTPYFPTQKRLRPPVWNILVLHAELSSVRALLVRPLSLQPPIHSRTCVRCAFPVACKHTNKNQKMQMQILTNAYRRRVHAHTHKHTQTPTQEHMHTTPSES
jgi:hypothetical protein